ncbi:FAD/NAD(P)-binding oxidoreductase [Halorientalis brevis]|uniref:FAD/NAD(P)-binding oxidoreductase n=1 Tax=Halorientalis brevis TaxID=1126241 RepID=A0ABD6CBG0_9EURY|nr:FAD/NAD(P)-binding oxidoreductase [Halorientalis brevis]
MPTDDVLVLGAGAGGTMAANMLDRKLDRDASITVVDKSAEHHYQPAYYLIPFGYMEPENQHRPVEGLLRDGVEFVQATVEGVDPDAKQVETDGETLEYDYLISALGNRLAPESVPGMLEAWEETDAVYPFYHYDAAVALREAVQDFDGGQFLVTVPETPIKCGGAPLKMAMLAEDYFRRQGIRDDVDVAVAKPTEAPFGTPPSPKAHYNGKVEEIWAERDIEFLAEFEVEEIDYENERVVSTDGREVEYDLYAPVPPQYGQPALTDNSPLTDGEYVTVDKHTLQHDDYDDVFAIGDNANLPTSRTASAARKQVHVLVKNLKAVMADRPLRAEYDGYTACPVLTKKGKAMIAEFNYEDPIAAPVETRSNWVLDVNVIPPMYWNMWMRGYDPIP